MKRVRLRTEYFEQTLFWDWTSNNLKWQIQNKLKSRLKRNSVGAVGNIFEDLRIN